VTTNSNSVADPRIKEALNVIFEYALGNLKARGTISAQNDDMDALITGINILGEELEAYLSERKRAEEQLIEAQEELVRKERLSLLGQLSGSVGHELRSPLGIISNAVYFLKTVLPEADDTVREYLDIIKSETKNAERIITDLLDFSRAKRPQSKRIAIDELLRRCCASCTIRENVTLQLDLPDTSPSVLVDPLHMEQVFRNLTTNGVQAMPGGGVLTIRAKENPEDGTVRISITDTGEGIAPENMKKLFLPLFTTKARGIGLGLIVSRNLVEANGGRIEVESRVGTGTTFTVILPVGRG
jgi:signal transduction histidine kinase